MRKSKREKQLGQKRKRKRRRGAERIFRRSNKYRYYKMRSLGRYRGIFFAFALGALIFLLNQNMVMRGIERKSAPVSAHRKRKEGAPLEVLFVCCADIEAKDEEVGKLRDLLSESNIYVRSHQIPCLDIRGNLPSIDNIGNLAGTRFPKRPAEAFRALVKRGFEETVAIQGVFCRPKSGEEGPAVHPEISNIWVRSLLRDLDNKVSASTLRLFQLQDKGKLHNVLNKWGLQKYLPTRYTSPDDPSIEFPVMAKREIGASGKGVYICEDREQLKAVVQNRHKTQNHDALFQKSIPWLIEQAVVDGLEYMYHYVHTPESKRVFMACTKYVKKEWQEKKLYVKGTYDQRPQPTRTKCNKKLVSALRRVIVNEKAYGMGCVGFKLKHGVPKIFDWNMRQCGSMTPLAISKMLLYGRLP